MAILRVAISCMISEKKISLADWAFHHHLADSDDEVATEQLTAVVDARID